MVNPIPQLVQASFYHAIPFWIQQTVSADNPIFVACSGGRDSMVLLYLLHLRDLPIVALHINHRLQAPSDNWENLVQKFCQRYHIPFFSNQLTFENSENVSEQQARNARYQAISELIQDYFFPNPSCHTPILALAHHANDQAETVLMRLCYGAGLHGLSGMAEWTLQSEFSQPFYLWRPLLSVTREQISNYANEQPLAYVDDPTNATGNNQRALLRQYILPTLAQVNGLQMSKLVQNIARSSHNLADAAQILDAQAKALLQQCQKSSWTTALFCLDIDRLRALGEAQRFYVLHFWLKQAMNFAPPRRFIEQINQLILSDNPDHQTILQWNNQQIRQYRNTLYLLSEPYINLLTWAGNCGDDKVKILENTTVNLACIEDFTLAILFNSKHKISQNLTLRKIKNGEKFQLINRNCHQTFKNICQSLSIPSWERSLARVVELILPETVISLPIVIVFPTQTIWLLTGETLMENSINMSFDKMT